MTSPHKGRLPRLVWRKPGVFWGPLAFVIGLGVPGAVLMNEGGFAQLALATAGAGMLSSLLSLAIADASGREPRSRREIVVHVFWLGALSSLCAPPAFLMLVSAVNGGAAGLSPVLGLALWPLALSVGLPMALFAGLTLSYVAFAPEPAPEEDVFHLDHRTDPALGPDRF